MFFCSFPVWLFVLLCGSFSDVVCVLVLLSAHSRPRIDLCACSLARVMGSSEELGK